MSRLPRKRTSAGSCTILTVSLLLLALLPLFENDARAGVENVREQFLGPPVSSDNAYSNKKLAQSFIAQVDYLFTRVELYVWDIGNNNSVDLMLHHDSGVPTNPGPVGLPLTFAQADGPDGFTWLSFVFNPPLMVTAGLMYWLVLVDSNQTNQNGYAWGKRDTPPLYNFGYSGDCTGASCTSWNIKTNEDYLFINYGITDPSISASLTVDSLSAGAGDPLQYSITFENVGVEVASRVWINMSLSSSLSYVSDDSSLINGVHNPQLHWMFLNVDVGSSYVYHVNASVAVNVQDGTFLKANITIQYSNAAKEMQEDQFYEVVTIARVPSLTLVKSVTPDHTIKNSTITYRLSFLNSGSRSSAKVWVNDTLPNEVTYLFDTASNGTMPGNTSAIFGGMWVQGRTYMYNFTNVTPGAYVFDIVVRINSNVENGTAFINTAILHYTDSSNRTCGPVASSATARVDGASIQVQILALQTDVSPGDNLTYLVIFNNVGTARAAFVWINVSLPLAVTFDSDTAGSIIYLSNASRVGQTLRYIFINIPVGMYSFAIRTHVNGGVVDGQIITVNTCLNYTDWDSHMLLPTCAQDSSTVSLPIFTMAVFAPTIVDPGDLVTFDVILNNSGSGVSKYTWLSIVEPSELTHTYDNTSLNGGEWQGLQKWLFKDTDSGSLYLGFDYKVKAGLPDGYLITTIFELNYTDYKGRYVDFIQLSVQFTVTTPNMTIAVIQNKSSAARDDTITYTIYYNNTGNGTSGSVWINDTIPEGTVFYQSSELYSGSSGSRFVWHFVNVAPGNYYMTVTVRIETFATIGTNLTNTVRLTYNDANGNQIGQMSVQTVAKVVDGIPNGRDNGDGQANLLWVIVASLIFALMMLWLFVARKFYGLGVKNKARISELFLLHRSGELIRHHSRSLRPDVDSDLLSAMLVAVQNFVKESFNFREGDLEELKFGNEKIMLMHGQHVILAAVIDGPFPQRIVPVISNALEEIESRFGPALDSWSGLTEDLPKIDDVLSKVFVESAD